MNQNDKIAQLAAELYDVSVPDWPGELDFYQRLAETAQAQGQAVLEVACGTGRVAVRLAQTGVRLTGLDLSARMLAVARRKSAGLPNLLWVEGDMRNFELDEMFGLALIPGHAFQNLVTPGDQVACLECIRRHLLDGGLLVVHLDHQDVTWLGSLRKERGRVFEAAGTVAHPESGQIVRLAHAWSYAPASQTATVVSSWELLDAEEEVIERMESKPLPLHCLFRFEMEHLAYRADFQVEAVFGDFFEGELRDESPGMIWVLSNLIKSYT
jgi:ubiquinone/menaquinone biosynthesis C-methylase UbiE